MVDAEMVSQPTVPMRLGRCGGGLTVPLPMALRALGWTCLGVAIGICSSAAAAQASGGVPGQRPTDPNGGASGQSTAAPTPPVPAPKSLDDLLGTTSESPNGQALTADEIAAREQARRLDKALEGASMQDLVSRAVEGMRTAAGLLEGSKDTGLGTQRTQEEVIRALDRLLEEAKRQERKQKGSKSSSSKSGKQKQSQDPAEQNGQQSKPQQQRQDAGQASSSADSSDAPSNDGTRSDDAGTMGEIMESRVEWGQLPERIRELVLQGRRDRVSSMYERLTREYYRRLAEEASK